MKDVLILCPFRLDAGLVSFASRLFGNICVLARQEEANLAAEYGAGEIVALQAEPVADEGVFARFLAEKIVMWQSRVILAPATVQMRSLMPMLAWQLHAGLTADCTGLSWENERLIQTRPAFGNARIADITARSDIQMATVRPGMFPPVAQKQEHYTVETLVFREKQRILLSDFLPFSHGKPLSQARIVIAGGMGVGSKEGFSKLERLADKLGAGLGASRMAVDAGFAPHHCQVGLTGVTVCPKLYLAVGISGAVQHLAGMSGAEKIIAINHDPHAPIFEYADYGVVGAWEPVIEELLKEDFS